LIFKEVETDKKIYENYFINLFTNAHSVFSRNVKIPGQGQLCPFLQTERMPGEAKTN
jgi:hypothetical protein